MIVFYFSEKSKRQFRDLPELIRERIRVKLHELKSHPNIFFLARPVYGIYPATHRLRVGKYRILMELIRNENNLTEFEIFKIDLRGDIYR